MSDQATPGRDSSDDKQHGVTDEVSEQNREEQQPGAQPDHAADRPMDPSPADESP